MNTQDFEENLKQMTKPEVDQLKHQDMLAKAVTNAKDRSVISWWWLSIPIYLITMLLMKSFYVPETSLISNLHDLTTKQKLLSVIFFFIIPVVFIVINFISIRKVHILCGNPKTFSFLLTVWFNILMIFLSVIVLIIYSL